jgi:hypothetical protein
VVLVTTLGDLFNWSGKPKTMHLMLANRLWLFFRVPGVWSANKKLSTRSDDFCLRVTGSESRSDSRSRHKKSARNYRRLRIFSHKMIT